MKFYFTCGFVPGYMEDLCDLVMTAGGTVLKSKEELVPQSCDGQAKLLVDWSTFVILGLCDYGFFLFGSPLTLFCCLSLTTYIRLKPVTNINKLKTDAFYGSITPE